MFIVFLLHIHWLLFFCYRLRGAGLLALARLVDGGDSSRIGLDRSLLTALVDRWRPKTHTFHLPCGEMVPTLQDVSFILGLPLVGEAVGPRVIPPTWMYDLEARFADVDLQDEFRPIVPHPTSARGPSKRWLLQFYITLLTPSQYVILSNYIFL